MPMESVRGTYFPLEGHTFNWKVEKTFVNGHLLYDNGKIDETYRGQELRFR